MPALITGATGLIGRKLAARLGACHVLTRDVARAQKLLPRSRPFLWEPHACVPLEAFEDVDAVYNLAGEGIADGRWTPEKKKLIFESRVIGTRNLVNAIERLPRKPRTLISGSAIGFYGDRGDEVLDELSHQGSGFLANVCSQWEMEAKRAAVLGLRVVSVRTGIVLSKEGGALPKMAAPFEWGIGGPLGCGAQWMSWIHIDDLVSLLQFCSDNFKITGIVNGTAPQPMRNGDFAGELGRALHKRSVVPIPRFVLRMVMGAAAEALLASIRALPDTASRAGFIFAYPGVRVALSAIYNQRNSKTE